MWLVFVDTRSCVVKLDKLILLEHGTTLTTPSSDNRLSDLWLNFV